MCHHPPKIAVRSIRDRGSFDVNSKSFRNFASGWNFDLVWASPPSSVKRDNGACRTDSQNASKKAKSEGKYPYVALLQYRRFVVHPCAAADEEDAAHKASSFTKLTSASRHRRSRASRRASSATEGGVRSYRETCTTAAARGGGTYAPWRRVSASNYTTQYQYTALVYR